MKKSDFHFDLPKELIAQHPTKNRSQSRMLAVNKTSGQTQDLHFTDLLKFLNKGDLLVFNNTKVIPARLYGKKKTGGKVEVFIERLLNDNSAIAMFKSSKAIKLGVAIYFDQQRLVATAKKGMSIAVQSRKNLNSEEVDDVCGSIVNFVVVIISA